MRLPFQLHDDLPLSFPLFLTTLLPLPSGPSLPLCRGGGEVLEAPYVEELQQRLASDMNNKEVSAWIKVRLIQ